MSEPAAGDRSWGGDWEVGLRAWVERDGHVILGKGRLELLEAIDRWHSISAAARQIGMSYRHAWLLVQGVNEAAGGTEQDRVLRHGEQGVPSLDPRAIPHVVDRVRHHDAAALVDRAFAQAGGARPAGQQLDLRIPHPSPLHLSPPRRAAGG